ncbi:conserved hypothetical protein [Neospora caninum Liverpool]|uniref:Inositol polyphosphate kinase n=1 Tax=Neospora caninum (strain Liverpool) TaxID=572307 RepID=F0VJN8_NEOCL|nr:conserved hypothetical protein [Neospora caninum Liverpool]CBZ53949.1 conserved hypothetical protein [Neospora caninum Liverpool]|eukprot:XP_003883981.1 conserved hypothetical protein [Neospora caninum Liverpool]
MASPAATASPLAKAAVGVPGRGVRPLQTGLSSRLPSAQLGKRQARKSSLPSCASPSSSVTDAGVSSPRRQGARVERTATATGRPTQRRVSGRGASAQRTLKSSSGGVLQAQAVTGPVSCSTPCESNGHDFSSSPSVNFFDSPSSRPLGSASASSCSTSFSSSLSLGSPPAVLCPCDSLSGVSSSLEAARCLVASTNPPASTSVRPTVSPACEACDDGSTDDEHPSALWDDGEQRRSALGAGGVETCKGEEVGKARRGGLASRDDPGEDRGGPTCADECASVHAEDQRPLYSPSVPCPFFSSHVRSTSPSSPPRSGELRLPEDSQAESLCVLEARASDRAKGKNDASAEREVSRRLTSTPTDADDRMTSSLLDAPSGSKSASLPSSTSSLSSPSSPLSPPLVWAAAQSLSAQDGVCRLSRRGNRDSRGSLLPQFSSTRASPPRAPLPAQFHRKSKSWVASLFGQAVQSPFSPPPSDEPEDETEFPRLESDANHRVPSAPSLASRLAHHFLPCFRKGFDRSHACSDLVRQIHSGFAGGGRHLFASAFWGPGAPALLVPLALLCDPAAYAEELFAFPASRFARIPLLVDADGYLYRYVPEHNVRELEFFQLVQLAYERVSVAEASPRSARFSAPHPLQALLAEDAARFPEARNAERGPRRRNGPRSVVRGTERGVEGESEIEGDDAGSFGGDEQASDSRETAESLRRSALERLHLRPDELSPNVATTSSRRESQENKHRPFWIVSPRGVGAEPASREREGAKEQETERQETPAPTAWVAAQDADAPASWPQRLVSRGRDASAGIADVQRQIRRAATLFTETVSESLSGVVSLFPSRDSCEGPDVDLEIVDSGAIDRPLSTASLASSPRSSRSSRSVSSCYNRGIGRSRQRLGQGETKEETEEEDEGNRDDGDGDVVSRAVGPSLGRRGRGETEGPRGGEEVAAKHASSEEPCHESVNAKEEEKSSFLSRLLSHAELSSVGERLDGLHGEVTRRVSGLRSWSKSFHIPSGTAAQGALERNAETPERGECSTGRRRTQEGPRHQVLRNAFPDHAPAQSPPSSFSSFPRGSSPEERRASESSAQGDHGAASVSASHGEPDEAWRRMCRSLAFLKQNRIVPDFAGVALVRPGGAALQDAQRRRLARVYAAEEARKSDERELRKRSAARMQDRPSFAPDGLQRLPQPTFESSVDFAFSPFAVSREAVHSPDSTDWQVGERTLVWEKLDDEVRGGRSHARDANTPRDGVLMLRLHIPLAQPAIPCLLQVKLGRSFIGSHAGDPAASVRQFADSLGLSQRSRTTLRIRQRVKAALFEAYDPGTAAKMLTNLAPADVGLGDVAPFLSVEQLQALLKSWQQAEECGGVKRVTFDRMQCAGLDAAEVLQLLHRFLSLHRQVASVCLVKISALIEWLRHQPFFRFYSTSLFLFVDLSDPAASADCRWASFSHAVRRDGRHALAGEFRDARADGAIPVTRAPKPSQERGLSSPTYAGAPPRASHLSPGGAPFGRGEHAPERGKSEERTNRLRWREDESLDEVNAGVLEGLEAIREVARACIWGT